MAACPAGVPHHSTSTSSTGRAPASLQIEATSNESKNVDEPRLSTIFSMKFEEVEKKKLCRQGQDDKETATHLISNSSGPFWKSLFIFFSRGEIVETKEENKMQIYVPREYKGIMGQLNERGWLMLVGGMICHGIRAATVI